jgi:hypothetical protein
MEAFDSGESLGDDKIDGCGSSDVSFLWPYGIMQENHLLPLDLIPYSLMGLITIQKKRAVRMCTPEISGSQQQNSCHNVLIK